MLNRINKEKKEEIEKEREGKRKKQVFYQGVLKHKDIITIITRIVTP